MTRGQVAWVICCLFWAACFALGAASVAATHPVQAAGLILAAGGSVTATLIAGRRRTR